MELKRRKDVPVELTWDLSLIYATEEEMFADAAKADKLSLEMEEKYKGKLNTPEMIEACLNDYQETERLLTLTGNYCHLAVEVDYYDTYNAQRAQKMFAQQAQIAARLSFVDSEIVEQDEEVIRQAIAISKGNKGYLEDLLVMKAHRLSPETEKVLAALGQTFNTPYNVYNNSKLADMQFENFTVNGKEYPLGYSLFEDDYEYEPDTEVRRAAFKAFSKKLKQYENTTATAYNARVTYEKTMANLRGYASVFDYLLEDQKVTREMYDRQIDMITTKLAPYMRKYAKLLQKIYGLDKMTFADLKIAVDPTYSPSVTIPEAKKYIQEGLSCLGEDYLAMVNDAFDQRWIDFAQNQGKSTGGFCSSPYGKNSYILLSFSQRMADVFTLAHELGHAGHFKAANSNQSIFDTRVSRYFVEAPSTCNELIMTHYMLKTNTDPRFQRWVLSSMVGKTYYHNFVTHLLEAAYQREVYKIIDQGGSVNAEVLSKIKKETLQNFWGDAVEIDDDAALTWMRQPHYYMGLYSYTYSAGLTVATQVAKRIDEEGQPAVDDWKAVLRAGSTLDPIGLAQLAKVDITTDAPLQDTIDTIGSYIEEICRITEELSK